MQTDELLLDGRALARRLEAHASSGLALLVRESIAVAGGRACFDGAGSYLNKACGFGPDHRWTEDDVRTIEAFFTERGAEPKAELSSYVDPSALAIFAARGFVLRELETTLARELRPDEDLRALLVHRWPPSLTIERVDPEDPAAVEAYAHASACGFVAPGEPVTEQLLAFARAAASKPTTDCFLARLDGRAVGGGAADSRDGTVALLGASVAHDARRLGIQQALVIARLEQGRSRGCTLATITSLPGIPTERNALRLGFRVAYSRVVLVKHGPGLVPSA